MFGAALLPNRHGAQRLPSRTSIEGDARGRFREDRRSVGTVEEVLGGVVDGVADPGFGVDDEPRLALRRGPSVRFAGTY